MSNTRSRRKANVEEHIETWKEDLEAFDSRPEGQSISAWCLEHGISRHTFYARRRKVLAAEDDQVQASPKEETRSLVRIPVSCPQQPERFIIRSGEISIDIPESFSEEALKRLLKVIRHAE